MLKLPSKQWKKVHVKEEGGGRYTLLFISPVRDEQELRETVEEDIEECLREGDRLIDVQWDTKSVTVEIADYETFKQRLIFVNILIEE